MTISTKLIAISTCLLIFSSSTTGHGYLKIPISRNVLHNGGSYGPGDIQSLDAGATGMERANGHGICGDILPRNEFEAPNKYGPQFPTVATYVAGQTIDIEITITAHHWGWFEFRLCRNPDGGVDTSLPSTQECLNEHILQFDPVHTSTLYAGKMRSGSGLTSPADYIGNPSFYGWTHSTCPYLPNSPKGSCCNGGGNCSSPSSNVDRWVLPDPTQAGMTYQMKYKLPAGVTCPRCVLQWYYQTGNSVDSYPEGFWNCADISIASANTPIAVSTSRPSNLPIVTTYKPSSSPIVSSAPVVVTTKTSSAPVVTTTTTTSSAPVSSAVFATCGTSAWNCGSASPNPLQQPMISTCILLSGDHCCCNWGLSPGNSCGCASSSASSAVPTSFLSSSPTIKTTSFKPSSTSPTTKTTSSKPSSRSPTIRSSRRPTSKPSNKQSSAPTKKTTSLSPSAKTSTSPTVKTTSARPTVSSTPTSSTVTLVAVNVCGSNSWNCQTGANDPVKQPLVPGFIVANNAGNCCCNWGFSPIVSSTTPACSSGIPTIPVIVPTFSPSTTGGPSSSAKPSYTSSPTAVNAITYRGYYRWSWITTGTVPTTTNLGVAFSGHVNLGNAISESQPIYNSLIGKKILSIGGGNAAGMFTAAAITSLNAGISVGQLKGYEGICYDIEEGDSGLADAFAVSFAIAKQNGLLVIVTTSHSAPYGITDKVELMNSFFSNSNIDILSPQLYTSGTEGANDFDWNGTPWSAYATAKAAVVPSIVKASYYADAQNFFATPARSGTSFAIQGYIQWVQ